MKKHIKKKFLFEYNLPQETVDQVQASGNSISPDDLQKINKIPKDMTTFVLTETNTIFQAFPYRYQGQDRLIPEPDPVLVYFHSAYLNYRDIEEKRKAILKTLLAPKLAEPMINELYEFFGLTSGFVIFLFTAMEAFVNRSIPEKYEYSKKDNRKTEVYNKKQIEEYLPFMEKVKDILPSITGKNFQKNFPIKFTRIENLKEFRDSIIHTKTSKQGQSPYDYLYKKALEFKYEEAIVAVADYCNYYHPDGNYIIECDCNHEW